MISAHDVALTYGKRVIFKDVKIKFTPGNCYGLIGANGLGKSTFLKIIARELADDQSYLLVGKAHIRRFSWLSPGGCLTALQPMTKGFLNCGSGAGVTF